MSVTEQDANDCPQGREVFDSLPAMKGWLTTVQAAAELGISRQAAHKLIQRGVLRGVRRVGQRPTLLVSEKAVADYKQQRRPKRAE